MNVTEIVDNPTLIRDCIRSFDGPTSTLANMIGISQSTLCKIENKKKKASLEEIIKILIGTDNKEKIVDVLASVSEQARDLFVRTAVEKNLSLVGPKTSLYLRERSFFLIMLLAYSPNGTSREEIRDNLGALGIKNLLHLIAENLLKVDGDRIKGVDGLNLTCDQGTLKTLMINSVQNCYDSSAFGEQKNCLRFHKVTTNKTKAIPMMYEKIKKCTADIMHELNKSEYDGSDPMFFGMVFDTISIKADTAMACKELL